METVKIEDMQSDHEDAKQSTHFGDYVNYFPCMLAVLCAGNQLSTSNNPL